MKHTKKLTLISSLIIATPYILSYQRYYPGYKRPLSRINKRFGHADGFGPYRDRTGPGCNPNFYSRRSQQKFQPIRIQRQTPSSYGRGRWGHRRNQGYGRTDRLGPYQDQTGPGCNSDFYPDKQNELWRYPQNSSWSTYPIYTAVINEEEDEVNEPLMSIDERDTDSPKLSAAPLETMI